MMTERNDHPRREGSQVSWARGDHDSTLRSLWSLTNSELWSEVDNEDVDKI